MANNFIFVRLEYSGGSVPTGWAEYQTGETAVLPGNLNFSGNARRITGDMGSGVGSFANRLFFQSAVGTQTRISAMPPSGGSGCGVQMWGNPADLENSARCSVGIDSAGSFISSEITGAGSYVPLTLIAAGAARIRLNTDGSVEFPTAGTRFRADFTSPAGSVANRLWFQSSTVNGQTMLPIVPNGTSAISGLQLFGGTDVENTSVMIVQNNGTIGQILMGATGTGTQLPLVLGTSSTERMRIQTGGVIRLNGSNDNPISSNTSGAAINTSGYIQMRAPTTVIDLGTTGASAILGFYSGTSAVGSVSTNGTTTAYNTSSDYRLKDDVQPLDAGEATDRIMAYRPVTWVWKSDGSYGKGFIAHECQAVDPMTATGTKDQMEQVGNIVLADGTIAAEDVKEPEDVFTYGEGAEWQMTTKRPVYQGRDDSKMIPDMIAMMQRMELRIRELETEVALLKSNTP